MMMRMWWAAALVGIACGSGKGGSDAQPVDGDGDGFTDDVDCDDADAEVHPDAVEICDEIDNNCDGTIDMEDPNIVGTSSWHVDSDKDGFGDPDLTTDECFLVDGVSDNTDDCDDRDDDVNPDGLEQCNGIDDDCDGLIDDEDGDVLGQDLYFPDSDGDGYGDANAEAVASCEPVGDLVRDNDDCDDGDRSVSPDAAEVPGDGVDNDCDGNID